MARTLDEDELVGNWTLVGDELALLSNRRAPTKLAFALMLRFYALHGRFPKGRHELPDQVVGYVARLVKVSEADLALYEWDGRTSKEHRSEIRKYFGFRECTLADSDKAASWLAANVCDKERQADRVREALLAHLWEEKLEQPAPDRIRRIIGSAISQAEKAQTALISSRVPQEVVARMLALIAQSADPGAEEDRDDQEDDALFDAVEVTGVDLFATIREEPGNVSVKTIEREVFKLRAIRQIGLPEGPFADVAPKILASWRARVAAEAPSHLRSHPHDIQVTLLAAYLYCRGREITDTLVDLLIATVHRINARAETKVVGDFVAELKRVSGKENILFKMTEAALEAPEERVEDVIYPAVPGGYKTLVTLLHEYKAKGSSYRQHKQRVFKASYTNHYRTGLIQIIEALEFGSTNTVHAPMMQALALIKRYKAEAGNRVKCYALGETVPVGGIIPPELVDLLYRADSRRRLRILRSVYECGVFQTLREKLRCKEIWVVGAERWRNPDDDLPKDYEQRRAENYAKLRKPLDPQVFIDDMRAELDHELSELNDALGGKGLRWLKISERKTGAIQLTPLDAAPEPINLRRLKAAIRARWGVVPLMDMLAETALRTSCLQALTPVGVQNRLDPQQLFERLLLVIYAYGTGTGIRAAAAGDRRPATGDHDHSEDDLRYVRRRFLTVEGCREVARIIANATFAARHTALWGEGTTAVASDSTHFSAYDQNIFTEWHSRYRRTKRGVLIYWTVETSGAMAVHSQLIACSASEVHAMVEGAMRHGTDMEIEQNFVDSHGATFVGFGITRLLDFDLVARFKQINTMKLYMPGRGDEFSYPLLGPALTRPIRWDIIAHNYDLMMKYATAIRLRTATTEALLRPFTSETTHPAYAAMLEVGRAQRSIFLARYLRDRDLQRETESGLNVVENYNGVNDYIRFGKRGELASNRKEEQELGMLCLHILQSALGYINTLMIQDTLALPEWQGVLTDADQRGLTPVFHTNMTPYGEIQLNLDKRLALSAIETPQPPAGS